MEGEGHNFNGTFEGSTAHMESHQMAFDMSAMRGFQQGMHIQARPLAFPYQMMQGRPVAGGHFTRTYAASQQYPGHGYAPDPVQPQHQSTDDDIETNDDDVEEITASQVPQTQGKKKGTSHRGTGFVVEEDRVICSGWQNISKDAAVGTNQDKDGFHKRLRQYYLDNYDPNSKRSVNSIQKRWSTIQIRVSKFCGILRRIERLNQSGKSYHDMVNDAIKIYQETEPWKFAHCWEMLKDEPKWNDKVLEILQPAKGQKNQVPAGEDTRTQSDNDVTSGRPEGRDAAKKRKASRLQDTSDSSVAVDMLKQMNDRGQQMNDRGQQMDEIDSKHKEELIHIERAKFELAQKQLQVKVEMSTEANKMTRELTQEKLKVQKEIN